jgi:hypothetical protein
MKRPVFLSLLLTAVVLLVPAFVLVACENIGGTGMTSPAVAEGPMPNPEFPPVSGETPGQVMPPGENPGQVIPPGETPGQVIPPDGSPGGPPPPSGTPSGGTSGPKTTTTAASNPGGTIMEVMPLIFTTTRYEETESSLVWAGGWGSVPYSQASGGAVQTTSDAGASVTIKFYGTNISFVGLASPYGGNAMVTLDGGGVYQVDCYSANAQYQCRLWDSGILALKSHTVKVSCAGSADPASGGFYISVDAFDVTGTLE